MIALDQLRRILLVGALLCGNAIGFTHTAQAASADASHRTKLRILVDKVLQKHNDWVAEPWMIQEAAKAGFNVYSPRRGGDDLTAVRDVTRWCDEAGIRHLVWMRGTRGAPSHAPEADCLVWADGTVSRLWSPNSEQLWSWMRKRIIAYSRIASENSALMGVFLDFENYQPTGKPNAYPLSYDRGILKRFAAQREIALPDLAPTERKPWLEEKGLHDAFESFQLAYWRERCRNLRKAVDGHAPAFRFCIYPAPGTKFMREAAYPTWEQRGQFLLSSTALPFYHYSLPLRFKYNRLLTYATLPIESLSAIHFTVATVSPRTRWQSRSFASRPWPTPPNPIPPARIYLVLRPPIVPPSGAGFPAFPLYSAPGPFVSRPAPAIPAQTPSLRNTNPVGWIGTLGHLLPHGAFPIPAPTDLGQPCYPSGSQTHPASGRFVANAGVWTAPSNTQVNCSTLRAMTHQIIGAGRLVNNKN